MTYDTFTSPSVCFPPQCALPLGCPECSLSLAACWSNRGWVTVTTLPTLHINSHLVAVNCSFHSDWCLLYPLAVGRCRGNVELHNIRGRLALQETELWVCHHKHLPFSSHLKLSDWLFVFTMWCCVRLKTADRRHAGSSWTWRQWQKIIR